MLINRLIKMYGLRHKHIRIEAQQPNLKINIILKSFFKDIQLQLVDFKLEFGYDFRNNIILGDEISPDNCRLWDLNQKNDIIVSLDKDRFRNDLGGLIEAYSEIHRRINDFLNPN